MPPEKKQLWRMMMQIACYMNNMHDDFMHPIVSLIGFGLIRLHHSLKNFSCHRYTDISFEGNQTFTTRIFEKLSQRNETILSGRDKCDQEYYVLQMGLDKAMIS